MPLRKFSIAAALAALTAAVAPAHAGSVDGPILVYNAAGTTLIGYVSATYDSQNSFTYTTNLANALQVQVTTPVSSPFSMLELNPPGPNLYLGGVGGSGGYNLSGNGYTYLSGTALTAAGAGTSASTVSDINSLAYAAPVESTIWSVNNNVVTAQWVNADSSVTNPAQTFYDPVVNYLGLVGNLTTYNSTFGDNAIPVTFEFLGLSSSPVPEPASLGLLATASLCLLSHRNRRRRA